MPTLVAVRKNPWLRSHYDRLLAAGKRPKVALVAYMRKLLTAIHSLARTGKPFVPHLLPSGACESPAPSSVVIRCTGQKAGETITSPPSWCCTSSK